MLVYHRTQHADAIERDGFRDGYKLATSEGGDALEFRGVWVSTEWPLDENEGAHGSTVLALDIPEEVFVEYEWVEEDKTYREAMIPAANLNEHGSTLRRLSDDEVEALTVKRWDDVRGLIVDRKDADSRVSPAQTGDADERT